MVIDQGLAGRSESSTVGADYIAEYRRFSMLDDQVIVQVIGAQGGISTRRAVEFQAEVSLNVSLVHFEIDEYLLTFAANESFRFFVDALFVVRGQVVVVSLLLLGTIRTLIMIAFVDRFVS